MKLLKQGNSVKIVNIANLMKIVNPVIETSKDGLSESSSSKKERLVKLVKVATISNLVIQRPCCHKL